MKKCEFCSSPLSILIEWDEYLRCDQYTDKYVCSNCPSSTTFVFDGEIHVGYEYWIIKERDVDGSTIKSYQLRAHFITSDGGKPSYNLEIWEWRSEMQPRSIYKNIIDYKITPFNAEQKIKTVLTFM